MSIRHRINGALSRYVPERRLFLKTESETRYLRLTPLRQFGLGCAATALVGWSAVASAAFLVNIAFNDAPEARSQLLSDAYEARIDELAAERDQRAYEARSAQDRFQLAMTQISAQQTEILQAVEERRELTTALDLMRARMADAMTQRDSAIAESQALIEQMTTVSETLQANGANGADMTETLQTIAATLATAVQDRDAAKTDRETLEAQLAALELRIQVNAERQEEMLTALEAAVETSLAPLQQLFRGANLDVDSLTATVRSTMASSNAAQLIPVGVSSRSFESDDLNERFDELLYNMHQADLMRRAAEQVPFAEPVTARVRHTSGFGMRRHPISGRRAMHNGIDLAGARGTPIYATADGVVTSARYENGYGNTVRIRHAFGFETLYAHQSRLRVSAGDRVSRGDRIGDMGTTGASTGVHLHYEVHMNGRPVNPMRYLEAARNVF